LALFILAHPQHHRENPRKFQEASMPFIAVREARNLARKTLRLGSYEDQYLLIDLAAASQLGQGLSMKQLVLLHGGSATTVRRRVARLISDGHVVKQPNAADARSDCFTISPALHKQVPALEAAFARIIVDFQHRRNAKVPSS
jgi:hypothetical protein